MYILRRRSNSKILSSAGKCFQSTSGQTKMCIRRHSNFLAINQAFHVHVVKTYHLLEPIQLVKRLAGTGIRLGDVTGLDALRTHKELGGFGRHLLLLLHLVPAGEHLGVVGVGVRGTRRGCAGWLGRFAGGGRGGGSARLAFPACGGGCLRWSCYRCRRCGFGRRARLACSTGTRCAGGGTVLLGGGRSAPRFRAGAAGALSLSCSVAAVAILGTGSAAAMFAATLTRRRSRGTCTCACSR